MWHMDHGVFWGMHFFWWIFWVVFIVIIFLGVTRKSIRENKGEEDPLEILKKRLARGEISPEEFELRKKILEEK